MTDNNVNETAIAGRDAGESSDATIEIKIKTLDSQIHTLRVNRDTPVPVLKEQIAALTGVPLERQRLICRGKVLKDDQLLSDYHVDNGHTLHLVVRQPLPPSSSSTSGPSGGDGTNEQQGADPTAGTGRNRNGQVAHNVVFGTFNLQDQGEGGFPDLNRILATVLNSIGIGNLSPANVGTGAGPTMMVQGNAPDGGNQADSAAQVSQTVSQQPPTQAASNVQSESAPRSLNMPSAPQLRLTSQHMVIPDALTTLSQYLNRMVQAFSHDGYESQPHSFTPNTGSQDQAAASGMASFSRGLPRPAALGSLVQHTQQLLSGPARNAFSHLAGLLEGETTVTDTAIRAQIQSTALRDGILMQELGALLLELGRATLTLRMGQSHDESVVNAGPAVYISSSGPNPIMVQQPLPFQHGGSLGPFQTGFAHPTAGFTGGVAGAGEVPRNINIHIHSVGSAVVPGGGLVSAAANSDQGNQTNAPQSSGVIDQVGNGIAASRETGSVRVVPVRTVVAAVPVRPPTEGTNATNNVFYPLLTTIQQLNSTQSVPIRGLAQATIGLQSNGTDGAQQQSLGTVNFDQAQANSILAQIQAQAQNFQGGMQALNFQAQNVEGGIQTRNSFSVPAMPSAANTPVSVQHDTQNQSADCAATMTDQEIMNQGLSHENSATDIDGEDTLRNDNISNIPVSGSNEMAYIANAVLQQMMGTYGRSGRDNQQQSDQQQSTAGVSSRNESTSTTNEPKSLVKQFEDKKDLRQSENTNTEKGSGLRSADIDMQECDLASTSGKEVASTSCTNSQSKTLQSKSDAHTAVPAGLGLGGLQPLPSKRVKQTHKLPANNDAAPSGDKERELSIERGQNVQQDHIPNSVSNDRRAHENGLPGQLPGGLAQMFGSMAPGGRSGSGRVDIGDIMSQLLRTPTVNNFLRGVAEQTGTVAPGELSNIIEQVTQSPGLRNTMQQMTEQLGEHSEELENAFSGMVGRQGGFDFSRVMQQMMPIMSQVLGGTSGGTSFGLGSEAQSRASNSEASTEDDHAANQNSLINLEPIVQKLENHDPPQEVFRSMVENAMALYTANDGSHNGGNTSEVLHQLSNTEDLANEYLAMLNRDLIARLQSDSGSA
ncbi:uncharacterized protein LOC131057370 isoform X4 [Cryptomeria japonica]|uniref:uncharacterized protein LOC131057370 isoform X4 n=1 Tax=Cryptomeria japonica TaxID=3369 RepID=UPI0027DA4DFA|nr:uncharacterized protein LOC131057370 isoform X4 [Cryptomeria japonica]